MKKLAFASAVILAAALAHAEVREAGVTGGRVSGVAVNGIVAFKGIPFAAPLFGELRWKAPQPVKSWSGVKDASKWGPACMQDAMFPQLFGAPMTQLSEDCLYLNVWTPAKAAGDRLPVLVWIYGGGFTGGATLVPVNRGEQLAKKGVVFVSIAYRVGPLGFMAHPGLTAESKNHSSGNYGMLDMIAGLQWV